MPPGKLAAQAGHAFTHSLMDCYNKDPTVVEKYLNPEIGGSKVVLKAKGLDKLIEVYQKAIGEGLPCALIIDSNHVLPPYFDGSEVITAIGIGPCLKHECKDIIKRFKCV